jgi:hypothetical protein
MPNGADQWAETALSAREAYLARFNFLDRYYGTTKADEIGALLGGLSLLSDGSPADPGYKKEWLDAVEKVLAERKC